MNTKQTIKLIEIAESNFILGSEKGNLALAILRQRIFKSTKILEISFEGIWGVDACFVRNSIASLAKMHCGDLGVMVSNVVNEDVFENLCYGFKAKEMPLFIKNTDGSGTCYAQLTKTQHQVLECVYVKGQTTTEQISKALDKSAANVSGVMKKLLKQGHFLADKSAALTGGIEYAFTPYFKCKELKFESYGLVGKSYEQA